jgi:hypothetical protein
MPPRFGDYMRATAGGTDRKASSSFGTPSVADRSGFRTLDRPTQKAEIQREGEQRRQAMQDMAKAGIRNLSGTKMEIPTQAETSKQNETQTKVGGIDTIIENIINKAKGVDFTFPGVLGAFQNLTKEIRPTADSFKNKNFLAVLENEFRKGNFNRDEYYDTYKDLIDEVFDVGLGGMSAEEMFNTQTVGAFNEAVAGDLGSDIQQRVDPIGFGRELLDKGGPQTSGQAEEFAKIDLSQLTNSPEDRRLAAAVMEARALAADKQSRQDANMGIMAASPALPGLPVRPPVTPFPGGDSMIVTPPNPVLTPVPVGGITPFDIRQFYASLPQYTQQGIMNPNLAQFYQNLGMFPGMTT